MSWLTLGMSKNSPVKFTKIKVNKMKKKNTDWDRVSKEPHEIAYCRRLARINAKQSDDPFVRRLAKSYLKITKEYSVKKGGK